MLSGRRWLQKISVARPLFTNQLWIWGVRGVRRATWTWLFQGDFDLKVFFSTYFFRQPHAQNHLLRRFWTIRDNLFNNFLEDTAKNYETNRSQIGCKHQKLQASTTSGPKIDDHYWPKRGSISLNKIASWLGFRPVARNFWPAYGTSQSISTPWHCNLLD